MNLSLTPRNMMQELLNETRKTIVLMINSQFPNLSPLIQKNWIDCLHLYPRTPGETITQIDENCDLYQVLRLLWNDWDILKGNFFEINATNGYGGIFRSYLNIMKHARNEWAHQNTYTYEDVLSYGFGIQKFFKNTVLNLDISTIDQIVEFCLEEISKSNNAINTNQIVETEASAEEVETKERAEGVEEEEVKEEDEEEKEEEEEGEALEEEEYEEETEAEEEDEGEEVEEEKEEAIIDTGILAQMVKMIERKDYKRLSYLVKYPYKTQVEEGKYPNTLYVSGGFNYLCFGFEKLRLVEEYILDVAFFALFGFISKSEMKGVFQGNDIICIPSESYTKVSFGINKAQLLCATMYEIVEWL